MIFIVTGSICFSLKDLITPKVLDLSAIAVADGDQKLLWEAILVACLPVIFFWFFLFVILNHVKETLKIDPKDFAIAYMGVASLIY